MEDKEEFVYKPGIYARFLKRPLDMVCSFFALLLLSPVYLVLAVAVRIKLGGPVIFCQERPGKDEKIFKLYKFRTMTNECDAEGKLLPDEKRLTKFGRFLRSTSLDELPEIWNIFKGDMSVVGPRPLLVSYLPYYTDKERHRHDVRPGLTGLAQVNGRNAISDWEERFSYDLKYISNCNFRSDACIFFQTIKKVFKHSDVLMGNNVVVGKLDEIRNKNTEVSTDDMDGKICKSNKKLAIIGGGHLAGLFAVTAKDMGIKTYCFSLKSGIADETPFDHIYDVDILNKERLLDICRKIQIDGVIATTELTIAPAAFVAEAMHLNGLKSDIADVITDKYRNRKMISNVEGLLNPRFIELSSIDDFSNSDIPYPIILKPTAKGGKRGISVVYQKEDFESAFKYAVEEGGKNSKFIVEEYIDGGMECSVESLSYKGKHYIIQITEKITSGPPHCVELAHHQPARISNEIRTHIEDVLDKALTEIGVTFGACHTELKIKDGKVYLIEFNARPGGDHIAHPLTQLSTGYSYLRGAIEIAMDDFHGIDRTKFLNKCAGVLFVTNQTKELLPVFEKCETYPWFYKKNVVSTELQSIIHNNESNFNYFIYCSDERPNFNEMQK